MHISISFPPGLAYGADEAVPDMPTPGVTVEDALYHTVHGFPGGVACLAQRMGMSANTLTHKANPNNDTHHARPRELVAVQHLSGNYAVLHAMAAELGFTAYHALPAQHGGDPALAMAQLHRVLADFVSAAMAPAHHAQAQPTRNEVRRMAEAGADLHSAIDQVVAAHRARMRPAPATEGAA